MSEPPMPSREFLRLWRELFPDADFKSHLVLSRARYLGSGVRWAIVRFFYDLWPLLSRMETFEDEQTGNKITRIVIDEGKIYEWMTSDDEEKREIVKNFMKYGSYLRHIITVQLMLSPYTRDAAIRLFNTISMPKVETQYQIVGGKQSPFYEALTEIEERPQKKGRKAEPEMLGGEEE